MGRSLCPAGTSTDFSNSHDRYVLYVTLCAFSMRFWRRGSFFGALLRCGAISRTLGELARSRGALLPWRFPRYVRAVRRVYSAFKCAESDCEDRLCARFFVLVLCAIYSRIFALASFSPSPPLPPVRLVCKVIQRTSKVGTIRLCARCSCVLLHFEVLPCPPPLPPTHPALPPICFTGALFYILMLADHIVMLIYLTLWLQTAQNAL